MQALTDDRPLSKHAQDRLGREKYLSVLADSLLLPPGAPCRVVSVEGLWGEGKTSAIEMAIDLMGIRDADRMPFVARINPWQLGSSERLVGSLLRELETIARREGKKRRLSEFAATLASYESAIAILKVEPYSSMILSLVQGVVRLLNAMRKSLPDLESRKKNVSAAIEKSGRPIVIVLDDLDRLLPAEVVEVIRFVRAVGDFSQTTYVLAYDHKRVIESLEAAGIPSPHRFLDKIVQLRFNLPPIRSSQVSALVDESLSELSIYQERRSFEESSYRRYEVLELSIVPSIRDLRTLRRVNARLLALDSNASREIEFWDLFALNYLAVAHPELFELVRTNPSAFAGRGADWFEGEDEQRRAQEDLSSQLRSVTARLGPAEQKLVNRLMRALFPSFSGVASAPSEEWNYHNRRIAHSVVLYSALSAGTWAALPKDALREILDGGSARQNHIDVFASSLSTFSQFLDELRDEAVQSESISLPDELAQSILGAWGRVRPDRATEETSEQLARALVPIVTLLAEASIEPLALLGAFIGADPDGFFSARLLDELFTEASEISGALRAKVKKEDALSLIDPYERKVRAAVISYAPEDDWRLNHLLFVLSRVAADAFSRMVCELADAGHTRTLLRALGNGINSSDVGRVATWPQELRDSIPCFGRFEREAKLIESESGVDPLLTASAKAITTNRNVVVATGKFYRR